MTRINEILKTSRFDNQITTEDIPNLDLYMDQVIQLFERTFKDSKRSEKDKIITKTMINNYAKGNLLFPSKNKRYSKEHVMLISLIYELKGILTIQDIKRTLSHINQQSSEGTFDVEGFYESYLKLATQNVTTFESELDHHIENVKKQVEEMEEEEYVQQVLAILTFINMSNIYRKAAEKLIDSISEPSTN
ncbi:hypothetical protein CR203_15720 [Salipaludibacillus neizhouensis]|uniref:Cytoplasmic protein n=1 Tax=Salipaludibacillus neizhouensis TaxID=885475 RepID=A0A3A9K0T3_9BACI|nr:DUF1836 domain-containing protein [Salipaludibacillus neizhouensis]RKL66337.1 hypothetical protein CR203_15720 [Salipaludibacillus neizhouensis]